MEKNNVRRIVVVRRIRQIRRVYSISYEEQGDEVQEQRMVIPEKKSQEKEQEAQSQELTDLSSQAMTQTASVREPWTTKINPKPVHPHRHPKSLSPTSIPVINSSALPRMRSNPLLGSFSSLSATRNIASNPAQQRPRNSSLPREISSAGSIGPGLKKDPFKQ